MPGMSSTPADPTLLNTICPHCSERVVMAAPDYLCPQCGEHLLVDVDHDDASSERHVYAQQPGEPERSPREKALDVAIPVLTGLLQGLLSAHVPGMGPNLPVAGRVDCDACLHLLAGLRDSEVLLVTHLETGHDWWPADLDNALAELHKANSRIAGASATCATPRRPW